MTNFLARTTGLGALLVSLAAVPALAQDSMSDWDSNGDGTISQDEFNTGWGEAGVYDSWDEDGDGALSEDEFNTGVFESYDSDDSGAIEEPEFGDLSDDMGDGGFWDV